MYSFISGLFHSPCFWDSSMLWQVPNFTTLYYWIEFHYMGFPGGSVGKESTCNAGGIGFIPRLGNSSGEGNGNLLQYSCLGNPMDRGTWWATVHEISKVGHKLETKPPITTIFHYIDIPCSPACLFMDVCTVFSFLGTTNKAAMNPLTSLCIDMISLSLNKELRVLGSYEGLFNI